jgi:hypothetical protein
MAETERVINDLNVVKITLCNPQMLLTPEMRVRIGQVITSAIDLLKEQETIVRCKDCKYWLPMNRFHPDYHPGRGQCELNCWVRDSDWFCADGERR